MAGLTAVSNELVDHASSERSVLLTELLEKNHRELALLVHGSLHSHLAHILGSAFLMGGDDKHLRDTYASVEADLEPWQPSSAEIKDDDEMRQHLGDSKYQRAFIQYFQRRLTTFDGDWKAMVCHYLLTAEQPMLGGVTGGFGHPFIHVTDAFELANADLAVEALALTAVDYSPLAKFWDTIPSLDETKASALSPLEIFEKLRSDNRFDGLLTKPGVQGTANILKSAEARGAVLEYCRFLDLSMTRTGAAEKRLYEMTELAVLLLCTISKRRGSLDEMEEHKFDFYLTHQLTFCWGLRVLVPSFPASTAPKVFRTVWLLMVLAYIHQLRPVIKPELLHGTPVPCEDAGAEWEGLKDVALNETKERGGDPHYVKVIRTLYEFSLLWPEEMFLQAATRFDKEFTGWTGYGKDGEEMMDVTIQ